MGFQTMAHALFKAKKITSKEYANVVAEKEFKYWSKKDFVDVLRDIDNDFYIKNRNKIESLSLNKLRNIITKPLLKEIELKLSKLDN